MAFAELSLEDFLPLGKYGPNGKEGHSKLRVAIMQDARYINWALGEKLFQIDETAMKKLDQQLEKQG